MEKDINYLPVDPIEDGDFARDDDQNNVNDDVNDNAIYNVEEYILLLNKLWFLKRLLKSPRG